MFKKSYRLTTKDVRYIQKQRNIVRTEHFGFLRIPQYPNRNYHQVSIYIAADTIKKASRRHQIKRKLLEHVQSQILPQQNVWKKFYKIFIFLNKKTVFSSLVWKSKESRDQYFDSLYSNIKQERHTVNKKLSIS